MTKPIDKKLSQLRSHMQELGMDYYFVPAADQHQNEYVPDCWKRRAWISDFTGSAGDALVGLEKAYLWTDPRYFLQAEEELNPKHYELVKMTQGTAPIDQWLTATQPSATCAVDPRVISITLAKRIENALKKGGGKLLAHDTHLIDEIWEDQPAVPKTPIYLQSTDYAGIDTTAKLTWLKQTLKDNHAEAHVITMLDAIAWLFNIRGNDVQFNPLVISYAIVTQTETLLFVDEEKLHETDLAYFKAHAATIKPYSETKATLQQLTGKVWLDPNTASWWVEQQLEQAEALLQTSPITLKKAIKTEAELKGAQVAHEIDGVAVVRFLQWLDEHWKEGVTEISAADKLAAFRRENPLCLDLSFSTIAGFAAHGAIVHYFATPKTDITVDDSALFLIDSGAQYQAGTTDITRTIHLGAPTEAEKHHYTLVLKGHLALSNALFPAGTCGEHINPFARLPLWREGLDFGHGTGHGVGAHLCVHEGPQRISSANTGIPLVPGMIVSNEPGLYFRGQYGIRIENLCTIIEKLPASESPSGHGPFYQLNDLTLVPYARKLINVNELNDDEINWVNAYHQRVYETLQKHITDSSTLAWLKEATQPLQK